MNWFERRQNFDSKLRFLGDGYREEMELEDLVFDFFQRKRI
jgi:hypothetical protein